MFFEKNIRSKPSNARPLRERRAFSLLELTAVVMIIGLIAGLGITRFGHDSLAQTNGEGFVRKMALGLQLARRQAISEGVNAAVTLTQVGGSVTQWTIVRAAGGGDESTDMAFTVPNDVNVTATAYRWEFDYTGQLVTPSGGGTITIGLTGKGWNLQISAATGHVNVADYVVP